MGNAETRKGGELSDSEYLLEVAQAFDDTVRVGAECWVQFSNTLTRMIAGRLREIAETRKGGGHLLDLARELDDAERMGEETDVPEGVRWVQFSDTLARMISARLREIAARIAERRKGE